MNSAEFIERRIEAFGRGDIDAMVDDYTEESVIMTPMGNMVGAGQVRQMITRFVAEFGIQGTTLEVIRKNSTEHVAHFAWKAETARTIFKFGNETYFLDKDGKVIVHVFDGDMIPK